MRPKDFFPFRFGWMNLLLSALFLFFYISLQTRSGVVHPSHFTDYLSLALSLLSLTLLWQILAAFVSWNRFLHGGVATLFLFLYALFGTYRFRTKIPFDFTVMADNRSITFNREAVQVVFDSISSPVLFIGLMPFVLFLILPPLRRRVLASVQPRFAWVGAVPLLFLYLFAAKETPLVEFDEAASLANSAFRYAARDRLYQIDPAALSRPYPLVTFAEAKPDPSEKPHVFVIMVESFSAKFIEAKSPEGQFYTPYFNSRIADGLYVDRFYGNSIQSCKGQFAFLFSLIPSIKQKVFTSYTTDRFQSLGQVLHDHGYRTYFVKAYKDITFDNTYDFLSKNGFDQTVSIDPYLTDEDRAHLWGWGVEDAVFYRRFFDLLEKTRGAAGTPVFAVLHTVMNHMHFNEVPPEKRALYPHPKNLRENYANSIHLVDEQVAVFFEELAKRPEYANSIVILTGDHSYPLGEHGFAHAETSFYEEFFRTPFLVLWPGHLPPSRHPERIYSQLDAAPTILDLAGITPEASHFRGQSMLADYQSRLQYLVQPYNGGYLGIVDYPWKYMKQMKYGREYLFDLATDPDEKNDLAKTADPVLMERLRGGLKDIFLNQYLLERNEIFPDPETLGRMRNERH